MPARSTIVSIFNAGSAYKSCHSGPLLAIAVEISRATPKGAPHCNEASMSDAVMLALGFGFFALLLGYVVICDGP
jgi:hypothetical protein